MAYKKYTPRTYTPGSAKPFALSRSKIDLFIECPRCFYLDARLGVKRPSLPGFTLNIAVDYLLKEEFDGYREKQTPHPLMVEHKIDAVPFQHADLETWRHNFTGQRMLHKPTNFEVFGAVDDIWVNSNQELIIVDYKATCKKDIPALTGRFGEQYQRQMEVYQWLYRQNDFVVNNMGYFVYVNGRKDRNRFDEKLEFRTYLLPHKGKTDWIEPTLEKIKLCLDSDSIPSVGHYCEHCPYREAAGKILLSLHRGKPTTVKKVTKPKATTKTAITNPTNSLF